MSIATQIQRLQNTKAAIASSIEAKGVSVPMESSISDYPSLIDQIVTGGGDDAISDVNFYDYDGTLLHTYTKEQFLALQSMPDNPERGGLIAQGWNWTYEKAQEYVSKYGKLNVGQNYTTFDNKTRFYITIPADNIRIGIYFNQSTGNAVEIDFGDGSTPHKSGAINPTFYNTYAKKGDYIITFTLLQENQSYSFYNSPFLSDASPSFLTAVELGTGVTSLANTSSAFAECTNLERISIPNSITKIGSFYNCYKLTGIVFPPSITAHTFDNGFNNVNSLKCICLPWKMPQNLTLYFRGVNKVKLITIPEGVTRFSSTVASSAYSLEEIIIPDSLAIASTYCCSGNISVKSVCCRGMSNIPQAMFVNNSMLENVELHPAITDIGANAFSQCKCLKHFPFSKSIATIAANAFYYCVSLIIEELDLPNLTNIGNSAFERTQLVKVKSLGSITNLPDNIFNRCSSLREVVLPETLTTIGSASFYYNQSLERVIIHATTPPTLPANNFLEMPTTFKIYVPAASVDAYKEAQNWQTYASNIMSIEEL